MDFCRWLFWFGLVSAFGCGPKPLEQKAPPTSVAFLLGDSTAVYPLAFTDSLKIPLSPEHTYSIGWGNFIQNDWLYYVSGQFPLVVQRANLKTRQMAPPLRLDPNFVGEPRSIYAHTPDSIFVTNYYPTTLYLVNGAGERLQKWDLGDASVAWHAPEAQGDTEYQLFDHQNTLKKYNPMTGQLYLKLSQVYFWYYPHRAKNLDQAIYNLHTRKWEKLYGYTPPFYQRGQARELEYPLSLTIPQACEKGDTTLLAQPASHEVALLNNQTGQLLATPRLASRAVPAFAPTYPMAQREA
ncbi:MAG: hypothetical protein MUC97_11650 [Bernardetiaceae bacterium]|jgi:hypothetical protein|nr:hypothetical protein [Bernardetiaceae bacterium]